MRRATLFNNLPLRIEIENLHNVCAIDRVQLKLHLATIEKRPQFSLERRSAPDEHPVSNRTVCQFASISVSRRRRLTQDVVVTLIESIDRFDGRAGRHLAIRDPPPLVPGTAAVQYR